MEPKVSCIKRCTAPTKRRAILPAADGTREDAILQIRFVSLTLGVAALLAPLLADARQAQTAKWVNVRMAARVVWANSRQALRNFLATLQIAV